MRNTCSKQQDILLERIANDLLFSSLGVKNIGLYNGLMGCVIFFSEYARYSRKRVFEQAASERMDRVYSLVGQVPLLEMENGLCGVGWGIEYLLQHNLMVGDSDKILFDLDWRVMKRDLRRPTPGSFSIILDILRYVSVRLTSCKAEESEKLPFPDEYLLELVHVVSELAVVDMKIAGYRDVLVYTLRNGRYKGNPICIEPDMIGVLPDIKNLPFLPIGLYRGVSGIGLNVMLKIVL
ncbi:MAG: hypothetical protein IJ338_03290 [Bacteroidaceae bacterium]|nr:hypothetical protein [Bacteroidaceae bacterium]